MNNTQTWSEMPTSTIDDMLIDRPYVIVTGGSIFMFTYCVHACFYILGFSVYDFIWCFMVFAVFLLLMFYLILLHVLGFYWCYTSCLITEIVCTCKALSFLIDIFAQPIRNEGTTALICQGETKTPARRSSTPKLRALPVLWVQWCKLWHTCT